MPPPHVLIIEDEPAILAVLQATVELADYSSDIANSAAEAAERLSRRQYDLLLMDLGLPDLDGAELLERIRGTSDLPIVVVSGRDTEQEKIRALDLGADDFVPKPFLPGELLARIRAVMRRHARSVQPDPGGGDFPPGESFGNPTLAPLERKLFDLLASRRGAVVPIEEINEALWSGPLPPSNLRILVLKLRRKLEANEAPFEVINYARTGYRLIRRGDDDV